MVSINQMRQFLIQFSNTFPLDREYRLKHNIAFNSPAHRNLCQVDIYLQWLEDRIFEEHEHKIIENIGKETLYKKGEWISNSSLPVNSEQQLQLFDSIDLDKI